MDIYITEIDSGRKVTIPALPMEGVTAGAEGRFVTYEIMNKGPVNIPDGRNLELVTWESFLPGEARRTEPWVRTWTDPLELDAIFREWREKQPKLKLVVTDSNINIDCYITNYQGTPSGGYGDINYSISFETRDEIVIKAVTVSTTNKSNSNRTTKSNSSTYTVKSGDCLWNIAKEFYGKGNQWKTIYNANKEIIEKEAQRRGRKDSNNGWFIYPGTVLSIPGSGSSSAGSSSSKGTSKKKCTITVTGDESYRGTISVAYDLNGKGVASTGNTETFSFNYDAGTTIMVTILSKNGHSFLVPKKTGTWTNANKANIYGCKKSSADCGLTVQWVR